MTSPDLFDSDHFDGLFATSDDPWSYRQRWYEARKRAMTLACLPAGRYGSAFEAGCANGELSAALAERCDSLLIADGSTHALHVAKRRVGERSNVQAIRAWMPQEWPAGSFDLVVLSEIGYDLDAAALRRLAAQARRSLRPGGTVLACHWRPRIQGCSLDGDAVHAVLHRTLDLHRLTHVLEQDFCIDVWSRDRRSVAQREGVR